jgi:hypothetical protein
LFRLRSLRYAGCIVLRIRSLQSSRPAVVLALVALALRALVPAGYMAGGDIATGITVQLCTTQGLRAVVLPFDSSDPLPEQHTDSTCLYAVAAGAALPVDILPAIAPQIETHLSVSADQGLAFIAAIVRSQSSRGPPPYA